MRVNVPRWSVTADGPVPGSSGTAVTRAPAMGMRMASRTFPSIVNRAPGACATSGMGGAASSGRGRATRAARMADRNQRMTHSFASDCPRRSPHGCVCDRRSRRLHCGRTSRTGSGQTVTPARRSRPPRCVHIEAGFFVRPEADVDYETRSHNEAVSYIQNADQSSRHSDGARDWQLGGLSVIGAAFRPVPPSGRSDRRSSRSHAMQTA